MAFGSDLQGWPAHKALLGLQDFEINLLEVIRKCVTQRVKCEREYCGALSELINVSQKLDLSEFTTPFCHAWFNIIGETELLIKIVSENVSQLQSHTIEKLQQIINEKKALRKHYFDQRNRLDLEFYRLQDQLSKCKVEYQQRMDKLQQTRTKYDELCRKGRVGVKLDESRGKFVDGVSRVHKAHNAYVLALSEFNLYQRQYNCILLPDSLSLQQARQEQACAQCRDVLLEYTSLSERTSERFQLIDEKICAGVRRLKPQEEYMAFVNKHRAEPVKFANEEFQTHLINNGQGSVDTTRLVVNDLTLDSVKQMVLIYSEQLARSRMLSGSKRQDLMNLEIKVVSTGPNSGSSDAERSAANILKRELVELQCTEEKYATLLNILNDPLIKLGTSRPPSVFNQDFCDVKIPNFSSSPALVGQLDKNEVKETSISSNAQLAMSKIRTSIKRIRRTRAPSKEAAAPPPSISDIQGPSRVPADPTYIHLPATNRRSASLNNVYDADSMEEVVDEVCDELGRQDWGKEGGRDGGGGEERVRGWNGGRGARDLTTTSDQAGSDDSTSGSSTAYQHLGVEEETWFHGLLPRDEVQRLLVDDGDYLVRVSLDRKSGARQYVLSVRSEGAHKHYILQGSHEAGWRIEGDSYTTIQQLLHHHVAGRVPLTRKSTTMLERAVHRFDWQLLNQDIELLHKLGAGQFGEVFKGVYKPTGQSVAVKTCKEAVSEEVKRMFLREGRILKQYDHVNIVHFVGIAAQSQPVMIVMEFVSGGSLLTYLRRNGTRLRELTLMEMCRDVAAGMAYLQTKLCLHRDLAARNCLVGDSNVIKISDFGMSREEEEYNMNSGKLKQIPIKWTAPEALNYGIYTSASDVWSFGILMWEVFSLGSVPYIGLTNSQAKDKVDEGYRMPPPESCPDAIYCIMSECWEQDAKDRPQFAQLLVELNQMCTSAAIATE